MCWLLSFRLRVCQWRIPVCICCLGATILFAHGDNYSSPFYPAQQWQPVVLTNCVTTEEKRTNDDHEGPFNSYPRFEDLFPTSLFVRVHGPGWSPNHMTHPFVSRANEDLPALCHCCSSDAFGTRRSGWLRAEYFASLYTIYIIARVSTIPSRDHHRGVSGN